MADKVTGPFTASFPYTEEILRDFQRLYLAKRSLKPAVRAVLGLLGASGLGYFGWQLSTQGMGVTTLGYLVISFLAFLVAVSGGRTKGDETVAKYRKYYLDVRADFRIDENGIQLKLASQRNPAKTKFQNVYSLLETRLCYYLVISGKAYYILPKDAVAGGSPEDLKRYLEQHCRKRFQFYPLPEESHD